MKTLYKSDKTFVEYTKDEKGLGVFAKEDIKKGDIYEIVPTIEIPEEEDGVVRFTTLSYYCFDNEAEGGSVIGLGNSSLYNNDSDDPSAEYTIGNRMIAFKALKDIKKGDEIMIDYGWEDEYTEDFIRKEIAK